VNSEFIDLSLNRSPCCRKQASWLLQILDVNRQPVIFFGPIMLAVKEDCCRTLASIKCYFTDTIELVSVRFCALSLPFSMAWICIR